MASAPKPSAAVAAGKDADKAGSNGEKIFSNKILWGYVRFMDSRLGKVATDEVLKRIGLDRLALSDTNAFSTNHQRLSLTSAAREVTGEPRASYLVGRDLVKNLGVLNGFIAGVTSPTIFMKSAGAIEMRLARKTINTVTVTGKNRFKIEITYRDGFLPEFHVCENRIGCFEAAPQFFGLPFAKVEHPQCMHRGEGNCVYHVHFPEHGFLVWQRISRLLYLIALAGFLFSLFRPGAGLFGPAALVSLIAGLVFHVLYKHLNAKKSLEWSMLANEGVISQNQILGRLNAKLQSMYKVASELTAMAGDDDPCGHAVRSLVKEMGFGSAQIWLLDPEGREFRCAEAAGYPDDQLVFIRSERFQLADGTDNPHGLLIQALEQRETLIVNDMQDVLPRVSQRVRDFLLALEISSFIMTPLTEGDRLIGLLAGEHHDGEKIESNDRIIFQSLAQILTATLGRMGFSPTRGASP